MNIGASVAVILQSSLWQLRAFISDVGTSSAHSQKLSDRLSERIARGAE